MVLKLAGKVALVTGCGSSAPGWGNGRAITTLLARQGAMVVGVDRDLDSAAATQTLIADEGNRLDIAACDVTDRDQVARTIQDCVARHGRLDILINNVGQSEPGTPATMEPDVFQQQLDLNLTSAFLTSRSALPVMERQGGGAIVNISSVAGMRWVGKDQVGYAAAKAGLIHFTKVTAVAYAKAGVRLNCVVPGLMNTPLLARLAERYAGGEFEAMIATRHAQVPMGRMGDAWDIAHAALFLVSDEARYITGTEIVVDGGLTASTGTPPV
ncbi:putative oxidoreductase [Caenibius tardaugens NBRC 16725]|uniref:Putative oxidoreductase n=1 Tax=Caenibius tardaugens NBRC 16725 TaxID=1219035 RepID=U2YJ94_9SPHN|nr:SDR family NAD(P)-dependent oxidoreductase [Caenibius tardaugens]AZI34936.1 SDR family oxidoreductase [Caenibius tardaugens NBRC 16725]GAD48480.1 putative oxidoreductase [Caenibius tardaugens NBRC 16725]